MNLLPEWRRVSVEEAALMRERNRAAWRRHDTSLRRRRHWRRARTFLPIALTAAIAGAGLAWLTVVNPWPVEVTVRHGLAFRNCDAARAAGLAPAKRGQPGYWKHLDADGDGISCEPWTRW
ncbi:excalibur calcium-binding domain-containing protein [Siccirubricoccus sp. G192]|nr:excalibur calcium-binding domain-containing protein [Siccirubricoccus sp. G192]MBV1799404.1 excalibur calcium-binding domain-containing protein [Siccirubricoccus sp. G192]